MVKCGDGIIVFEVMKMENELKVFCDGIVIDVLVEEGVSVESGVVLVIIDWRFDIWCNSWLLLGIVELSSLFWCDDLLVIFEN